MNIITSQLANQLPQDSKLQQHDIVDPTNFTQLYQLLTSQKINKIFIMDATIISKRKAGTIIPVHDHINKTGSNILIGKQKFLGVDFIDMTNLYQKKQASITTYCCGEILNNKYEYSSHYLCNIATLAHAMNIKNIYGFLYNIAQQSI